MGSVLAIFVPSFLDHLRTSKVEEPPLVLGELHDRLAAYYEARHEAGRHCLPEAAGPAPMDTRESAEAYDFHANDVPGRATFEAIEFTTERPLRFRYEVIPRRAACGVTIDPGHILFTVRATGDLDGDGVFSSYERRATVDANGRVIPAGILRMTDPME
ncbi:MAG: hypothetical protein CMN30_09465 [Sandaracinus sp.]|nr:hypothetical protein [Sandaracinus sp.]